MSNSELVNTWRHKVWKPVRIKILRLLCSLKVAMILYRFLRHGVWVGSWRLVLSYCTRGMSPVLALSVSIIHPLHPSIPSSFSHTRWRPQDVINIHSDSPTFSASHNNSLIYDLECMHDFVCEWVRREMSETMNEKMHECGWVKVMQWKKYG